MSESEKLEELKKQFIEDTEKYLARIKTLTLEQLNIAQETANLTDYRSKVVKSTIELYNFINGLRLKQINERQNWLDKS